MKYEAGTSKILSRKKLKFANHLGNHCSIHNHIIHFLLSVPAILNEAVPATTQNVDAEIQQTTKLAFTYTGQYTLTPLHNFISK